MVRLPLRSFSLYFSELQLLSTVLSGKHFYFTFYLNTERLNSKIIVGIYLKMYLKIIFCQMRDV